MVVTIDELENFCEDFVGTGCQYVKPVVNFFLFLIQSLDRLQEIFNMRTATIIVLTATILALIRTKISCDGTKTKLGPLDLDDFLEVSIEYLVYLTVTLLLGSSFW